MRISVDDVASRWPGVDDPSRLLDVFYMPAVEAVNQLSCRAITPETTGILDGVVQEDGVTVRLAAWTSKVTGVQLDRAPLGFNFNPTVCDMMADGSVSGKYGRTLTLTAPLTEGTVVSVTATFGFDEYPPSLKSLVIAAMVCLADAENGTNRIQSKSIEDVSVSYTPSAKTDALAPLVDVFGAVVDKWSLCDACHGVGPVGYPTPHDDLPWWTTAAENFGGVNAY